jgi:hypothetical protein
MCQTERSVADDSPYSGSYLERFGFVQTFSLPVIMVYPGFFQPFLTLQTIERRLAVSIAPEPLFRSLYKNMQLICGVTPLSLPSVSPSLRNRTMDARLQAV